MDGHGHWGMAWMGLGGAFDLKSHISEGLALCEGKHARASKRSEHNLL